MSPIEGSPPISRTAPSTEKTDLGVINGVNVSIKIKNADKLSNSDKNSLIKMALDRIKKLDLHETQSLIVSLDSKGSMKSIKVISKDNKEYSKKSIDREIKSHEDKFQSLAEQSHATEEMDQGLFESLEKETLILNEMKERKSLIEELESQFNQAVGPKTSHERNPSNVRGMVSSGSEVDSPKFVGTPRYNVNFPTPVRLTQSGVQSGPRDRTHPTTAVSSAEARQPASNVVPDEAGTKQLKNIFKEISDTEVAFNSDLDEGIRRLKFMLHPENPDKIPEEKMSSDLGRVLKDYETLSKLSKDLALKLQTAQNFGVNESLPEFARIFKSNLFTEYSKYINTCSRHYKYLQNEIKTFSSNPELTKAFNEYKSKVRSKKMYDEETLFIKPTQRLPRIQLFFNELKKSAPEAQKALLEQTLVNVKKEAVVANLAQGRQEVNDHLGQLNSRLEKQPLNFKKYALEMIEMAKLKGETKQIETFFKLVNGNVSNDPKLKVKAFKEFFKIIESLGKPEHEKELKELLSSLKKSPDFIRQINSELQQLSPQLGKDKEKIFKNLFELQAKVQSSK